MGIQRRYVALMGVCVVGGLIALLRVLVGSREALYFAAAPQMKVSPSGLILTIPCPAAVTGAVYVWRDLAVEILRVAADGEDVRRERWRHLCMDWYLNAMEASTSTVPPVYVIGGTLEKGFYQIRCETESPSKGFYPQVYFIPRSFRRLDVTYAIHVPPDRRAVCTQSVTFLKETLDVEGCSVPIKGAARTSARDSRTTGSASKGAGAKEGALGHAMSDGI